MSYELDDTGDIVISGWENGIADSPHMGVGNLKAVNISTETGEVMCSYSRTQQSQVAVSGGTVTRTSTNTVSFSSTVLAGSWVSITSSGISGLSNGNYYYLGSNQISATYQGTAVTGMGAGTATFATINMGNPVAYAKEIYGDSSGNTQYRYYVLDGTDSSGNNTGRLWVRDTGNATAVWDLPYPSPVSTYNGGQSIPITGLGYLNGWLFIFGSNMIFVVSSSQLAAGPEAFGGGSLMQSVASKIPHFAFTGHQGKLYYTDGNFIGSIFPDTSLITGAANIQSYASYTASGSTGTISALIGGSQPSLVTTGSTTRIPAVFFTSNASGTSIPSSLTANTIYYILCTPSNGTFQVFDAASGGSAKDISTGASGPQYFNTFYPFGSSGRSTYVFTPQHLNLPFFETAQCMAELGNNVLIGTNNNVLYPWNQIDALPSDIIPLPERDVKQMITVSNMVYVFAGQKGNIYVTNGSTASHALTVPDYCAGIAGTPSSYFEPYFTWGGAMYLRGRVYFSILDQTASKSGNCGGIWSFVPPQNFSYEQSTGMGLRLENQNSYGTYNGVATILFSSDTQNAISPQYWAGWYSNITSPLYGIDYTNTTTSTPAIIETDFIPTGTLLKKKTFQQIEYKLSTPLAAGESVAVNFRQNTTDAFATCGSAVVESTTDLAGVFTINFEGTTAAKGQWVQLQAILTPLSSSSSSFVRLKELRIR